LHSLAFVQGGANQQSGKLEVKDVKMHKVPAQEDGVWTQVARYTFDGMDFDVTN
jgi:hypothetical protein